MKGPRFITLLVIAAGLLAYHNSFAGEFMFDDVGSIPENRTIRQLWPIWQCLSPPHRGWLTVEGRPFINLSLAINYALGGYNVWGYHALNLTVHIFAGLTLLGLVRRTLLQPALCERFGAAANELALATAVLWMVHPLQTESVTYTIQRAESIMGLFYLLTLYCFIRGAESPRPRLWYGLSVTACALGMASKEVMATAPLMVLLYDRAFLSGSVREAWRRRRPLYLGLSATWILLGFLLASGQIPATSMSAQRIGRTWWQYLATEPGVILYYLRLSVWPHPLCFDFYGWPIARTWASILPPTVVVLILLGTVVWALRRNSAWGFVGAWFFLILAPSSSIVPSHDPIFEHRMYLSLAAVVGLVVMGLYWLMGRRSLAVFAIAAIGLGFLTWRRNPDYRSEITIRLDAVAKFPNDPLAHYTLGVALEKTGRIQEAISHYEQALRIKPDSAEAYNGLGHVLAGAGKIQEAIGDYEHALRLAPDYAEAHNNLGIMLKNQGRVPEAIAHYEQALRIKPDLAEVHYNLGVALEQAGMGPEAIGQYEQALRINPEFAEAYNNLGAALWRAGGIQEARQYYEQALRLKPDFGEAHYNLGIALKQLGKVEEAIGQYEQALRVRPGYAEAHFNLGNSLLQVGRIDDALSHYEEALQIKPDYVEAQCNLGIALERMGRAPEAIAHYEQALRLKPDFAGAQNGLARLRAVQ